MFASFVRCYIVYTIALDRYTQKFHTLPVLLLQEEMSQMFGVPPTMFPQQQQGPGSYYGQQQLQQHSPLGALAAYKGIKIINCFSFVYYFSVVSN